MVGMYPSIRLETLGIKHRLRRMMSYVMEAERIFQFALDEELEDALAVAVLALEVVGGLVFQLVEDEALAVVVPVGVDAHQQVRFVPIDGVAEDVAFAGPRGVEPEA